MAGAQISTSVTIISSLKGFQDVSLEGMATTSVPTVLAGSVLEVAGAFFTWTTDETPNASSWTAIATTSTVYMQCTPSGSAGSQILTTSYTDAAPTWVTSKGAWYTSNGSNIRVIAHLYKGAATSYQDKYVYDQQGINSSRVRVGTTMMTRVYEIGEWNMDATALVTIAHGLASHLDIRIVDAVVQTDSTLGLYRLSHAQDASTIGGAVDLDGTNIYLRRHTGGIFDAAGFDATASTIANRGWVTITYEI